MLTFLAVVNNSVDGVHRLVLGAISPDNELAPAMFMKLRRVTESAFRNGIFLR